MTINFTLAKHTHTHTHTHSQTKVSYLGRDLRSTWLPYVTQICGAPLARLTGCGSHCLAFWKVALLTMFREVKRIVRSGLKLGSRAGPTGVCGGSQDCSRLYNSISYWPYVLDKSFLFSLGQCLYFFICKMGIIF